MIQQECINIQGSTSLQGQYNGNVMIAQDKISSEIYAKLAVPYILNLQTGSKNQIDGYSFAVSLDQKRLAYISQNDELIVSDATGVPEINRPFEDIELIQWVEDGLIVQGDRELVFLNPATGERKVLNQQFPDIYPREYGMLDPYWNPYVSYDPFLNIVVYIGLNEKAMQTYITVWSVEKEVELATVSRASALSVLPGVKPIWSQDGSQVILVAIEETKGKNKVDRKILSVGRDGTIKTLWIIPDSIGVLYYSLSPDQKKIAFWSPDSASSDIVNLSLYVLDIATGIATNYCIISPEIPTQPIWSPDSAKVVVELRRDLGNSYVVLVDFLNNIAIKIADDAQPIGWMKSP
jgi:hypothetical protein